MLFAELAGRGSDGWVPHAGVPEIVSRLQPDCSTLLAKEIQTN